MNIKIIERDIEVQTITLDSSEITQSFFQQIQDECILDYAETQFELSPEELALIWGKIYVNFGKSYNLTGFFVLWQKEEELRRTFFSIPLQANQWVALYYDGRLDRDAMEKYKKLYEELNKLPQLFIGE